MGVLAIVATATDALGGQADARANVSVTLGTQDEQGHQAAYAAMEAHLNASLTRGIEQVGTLQLWLSLSVPSFLLPNSYLHLMLRNI
jgi:hypothetical protein